MTSSASPVHQRYTAGSCTLDVTLHLSALSQWQPQLIAQQLQFQLWLRPVDHDQTSDQAAATLVAEGDRQTLQLVTHYIQQQTRATLALASFKAEAARPAPPLPPGCQIASPLSYLQLCDLTTVLNQCEQAVRPLPVSIDLASASSSSSRPSERTTEPNSEDSSNLISLASVRRRPRLWASSAAAAVFVIGLTTTLWPYVNQTTTTSAPEVASEPDYSAAAPRSGQSSDNPSPSDHSSAASVPSAQQTPAASATPENSSPLPALPNRSERPSASSSERPSERPSERLSTGRRAPAADSRQKQPPGPSPSQPANTESSESLASAPADISAGIGEEAPAAARQAGPLAPSLSRSDPNTTTAEDLSAEEPSAASAPTPISPADDDEANTIAQIQTYFEARWQPDLSNPQEPLAYQMRLSESGEVVTFAALDEAAQAYRDRLLPPNGQPLIFPISPDPANSSRRTVQSANTGLTLRLILTADGKVQISKF